MDFNKLKSMVQSYIPDANIDLLDEAYEFSRTAHSGQFRESGEAYIEHPLAVAGILAELELDVISLAAALLHDVVEDTGVTIEEVTSRFGSEIGLLVDGVTKLGRLEAQTKEEEQAENLRKMFLAMAKDIRVIIIKLADRLHNLRTLRHLSVERQRKVARETLDIFAPLAHRLGIFRIKWELEDLSLRYLEPDAYRELVELVAKKRHEREAYINNVISKLKQALTEAALNAEIQGRPKHFYSIYKKMYEQGKQFSEIYDLIAVRVIVDTVRDCYAVLGIVHTLWKPIPGRFKDFIAMPKPNMYQSIHTTVIGPQGEPFEIQIRTKEMHKTAEYGIAAHWKYKEGKTDKSLDEKFSWLRQILDWQRDLKDAREFMESLRIDLFDDEVFVFTPKGDVVNLPAGSTPVDFAYKIHTDVGHRCVGAKVNGRLVSLSYNLRNGDIVEIITSKQGSPSWDWLSTVKTSNARSKIKAWFNREQREESLARAKELIQKEIKKQGLEFHEVWKEEWVRELAVRFNCKNEEELLAAVAHGGASVIQLVRQLKEEYDKANNAEQIAEISPVKRKHEPSTAASGVRLKEVNRILARFSRCCNPVPGDNIVGYITRGRGVSIHRADCPNVTQYLKDEARIIEVAWEEVDAAYYPVEIVVTGIDRPGLLSDVAHVVADIDVNIVAAKARGGKGRLASIDLVLEIRNMEQVKTIIQRLGRVKDVLGVERVARERHASRGTSVEAVGASSDAH